MGILKAIKGGFAGFMAGGGSSNMPGPADDFWYNPIGGANASGVMVTPDTAMRLAAVHACIKVVSESVSSLPLKVFKRNADGSKTELPGSTLWTLFREQPNQWQTPVEYFNLLMNHAAMRGNFYAEIIRNGDGDVVELLPIHPDIVEIERLASGRLRYKIRGVGGAKARVLLQHQVHHVRTSIGDGLKGDSPIRLAAQGIGLGLAAERHGAAIFGNGARPDGVLTVPKEMNPEKEGIDSLHRAWNAIHSGSGNAGKVGILYNGVTFSSVSATPEDVQMLETRKFQVVDVCRIWRVPPHMVADLERATFSNIEQQSLEFLSQTLRPWLVLIEQAIVRDMIIPTFGPGSGIFVQFNTDSILRTDTLARFTAYRTGIEMGILSRNEVRAKENMNPVDGGDTFVISQNTRSTDEDGGGSAEFDDGDDEAAAFSMQALADDAGRRIANAEMEQLTKRAKHAASDRQRFNAWVVDLFSDKRDYNATVLAPLMSETGETIDAIADSGQVEWTTAANCTKVLKKWESSRANEVAAMILKAAGTQ